MTLSVHTIRRIRYTAGTVECACGWKTSVAADTGQPDMHAPIRDAWDTHRHGKGEKFDGHVNTGSGGWRNAERLERSA